MKTQTKKPISGTRDEEQQRHAEIIEIAQSDMQAGEISPRGWHHLGSMAAQIANQDVN